MTRTEILKWALCHTIGRIQVGYTMTSSDTADEWVRLSELDPITGKPESSIEITHYQLKELFSLGVQYPRSIAQLKSPIKAQAELEIKEDTNRKRELATLARLKEKYENA